MALFIKIIGWILVLIQLALFLIIMKEKDLDPDARSVSGIVSLSTCMWIVVALTT